MAVLNREVPADKLPHEWSMEGGIVHPQKRTAYWVKKHDEMVAEAKRKKEQKEKIKQQEEALKQECKNPHFKKPYKYRLKAFNKEFFLLEQDLIAKLTVGQLIKLEVCIKHGITKFELEGPRRNKKFVMARWEFYYRMKNETKLSYPAIARMLNKDHTTVIYGARKYAELVEAGLV